MTTNRYEVQKSDEEWKKELSPAEYAVLREAGTERAGTGKLLHEDRVGIYSCRACGNELFRSDTKFESHCGWPSFYEAETSNAVERIEDRSPGMLRVDVRCKKCRSPLGHVLPDAPPTPTAEPYSMNSFSLTFA